MYHGIPFLLFLTILIFLIAEGINIMFYRILADYDLVKIDRSSYVANFYNFWIILGLLQLNYFIISIIKYLLLSYLILKSNQQIHNDMLINLMRRPSGYFDVTATGQLINRFSNDLGVMDTSLTVIIIDVF
jgi:ATP-binding cassette subfamily C (CFTR/MRP) protein 4